VVSGAPQIVALIPRISTELAIELVPDVIIITAFIHMISITNANIFIALIAILLRTYQRIKKSLAGGECMVLIP